MEYNIVLVLLQIKKIAPLFKLEADTVYLQRQSDNVAVFPHEVSGRFSWSSIDITAVYSVYGESEGETRADATGR